MGLTYNTCISIYKIDNKNLLYSTGSYTQYFVKTYKENIIWKIIYILYTCVCVHAKFNGFLCMRKGLKTSPLSNSGTFSSLHKETPYPLAFSFHPLPHSLTMTNFTFCNSELPVLDIPCRVTGYMTFCFWYLSFSKHNAAKIYPSCSMYLCISFLFIIK